MQESVTIDDGDVMKLSKKLAVQTTAQKKARRQKFQALRSYFWKGRGSILICPVARNGSCDLL
jgi:hypothetical protein